MTSINLDQSLIDYLKQIPDERVPNGKRHPLWLILLIMIFGITSGYWGYRGWGRFVEGHRRQLIEILDIQQARVPSYSTIRQHWSIENRRHWVKDVVTKEDTSHQLQGQAATNVSLIKS